MNKKNKSYKIEIEVDKNNKKKVNKITYKKIIRRKNTQIKIKRNKINTTMLQIERNNVTGI